MDAKSPLSVTTKRTFSILSSSLLAVLCFPSLFPPLRFRKFRGKHFGGKFKQLEVIQGVTYLSSPYRGEGGEG